MDKPTTWLIRVFAVVLICVSLFAYLNAQANQSLLRSKPSIEDLEYKALDKLRGNAEFAENRDCLLYTSPSPRDNTTSRMPSSA